MTPPRSRAAANAPVDPTDRPRELADSGVIERRDDPTTYALTDWGRSLEPAVLALGVWGLRAPTIDEGTLSPASVMLFLRGSAVFCASTRDRTLKIVLDGRAFTVTVESARLDVEAADPATSDVVLACSPMTLYRLLAGEDDLETALAEHRAAVHGDQPTLRLLLRSTRAAPPT